MIKVENIDTWGFEHAIRGMRNPLNSWSRSDSSFEDYVPDYAMDTARTYPCVKIGENDLKLMRQLYVGGQPHRKYLRQIFAVMDITAPLYWWKEFDTYKVGTTANSCSTMHKIAAKEFALSDFSIEHLGKDVINKPFKDIIDCLNFFRELYNQHKDKSDWWQMIQLLPSSYNQRRTVSMTYEEGHKLDEWREFCKILKQLPYVEEIRDGKKERT